MGGTVRKYVDIPQHQKNVQNIGRKSIQAEKKTGTET
jgi:hypothetical protein